MNCPQLHTLPPDRTKECEQHIASLAGQANMCEQTKENAHKHVLLH